MDDADAAPVRAFQKAAEILQRTVLWRDAGVIRDVVAAVVLGRWVMRRQPDGVNPQVLQIVEAMEHARQVADAIAVAVGKAAGVDLTEEDISAWYPILDGLGPDGKTSMLQDMEARRISEAPYFGGKLISLGEKYGVPVPVNETLYRIIRTRESLFTSNQ